MRKIIRNMLRSKAEHIGVKPSRFVKYEFNEIQIKKYGETRRLINKIKGTHKPKTWRTRIAEKYLTAR